MIESRTLLVMSLLLCVGCGGQSAPSAATVAGQEVTAPASSPSKATSDLAFAHWQQETARIKEYESHADTVGTNWMSVMSARTSRMHSIPSMADASLVLGVSLQTDAAFLQQPEPSDDMSVIEAGAFWKSYGAALQIAEQKFRDSGDNTNAEKIQSHRAAVFN